MLGRLGAGFGRLGGPISSPPSLITSDPLTSFLDGERGLIFDLTDKANLFQDSARTTPVANVDDPIGSITDLSPNAWHATQVTAGARALYKENLGLGSGLFDGVDDRLAVGAFGGLNIFRNCPVATIIAAVNGTTGSVFTGSINTNGNTARAALRITSNKAEVTGRRVDATDTTQLMPSTANVNGVWHTLTGINDYANTVQSIAIDLAIEEIRTPTWGAGSLSTDLNSGTVSVGAGATSGFFAGNIARIFAINRRLKSSELLLRKQWAMQGQP